MQFIRFLSTRMFAVNLAIYTLVVLLAVWILSAWMAAYTQHGEGRPVPYVMSHHLSEALRLAEAANLELVISDSIYVEDLPGGTITEQNPDSSMWVKEGRKIYVTVSTYGVPKIVLPNLKYDDQRNVISQLEMLGFRVGEIKYIPSTCVDCLEFYEVTGKEISPGARLNNGTRIDLVLGGGKSDRFIPIPKLLGMKQEEAVSFLRRCSLSVGFLRIEEMEGKDSSLLRVYKQEPMPRGDSAIIYLGMPINLFFTDKATLIPAAASDTTIPPSEIPEQPDQQPE